MMFCYFNKYSFECISSLFTDIKITLQDWFEIAQKILSGSTLR